VLVVRADWVVGDTYQQTGGTDRVAAAAGVPILDHHRNREERERGRGSGRVAYRLS
jgi:hypothetical protein